MHTHMVGGESGTCRLHDGVQACRAKVDFWACQVFCHWALTLMLCTYGPLALFALATLNQTSQVGP